MANQLSVEIKKQIAKENRFKKSALEDMNFEQIYDNLTDMMSDCDDIAYTVADDGALLSALDGDEEEAWEFKMAFLDLSDALYQLSEAFSERYRYEDGAQEYNDCTVALVGEAHQIIGYDGYETDYFRLGNTESGWAIDEAAKRLARHTKAEMLDIIGRNMRLFLAYYDVTQRFNHLYATIEIIKGSNQSLIQQIRNIEELYEKANERSDGFKYTWRQEVKAFDNLINNLPDKFWVE